VNGTKVPKPFFSCLAFLIGQSQQKIKTCKWNESSKTFFFVFGLLDWLITTKNQKSKLWTLPR